MTAPILEPNRESDSCRVCGAAALFLFTKRILGRLDVRYFRCGDCGQVQTEQPHWLEEAYARSSWAEDVGMAGRSIRTAETTVALAWRLGVGREAPCLDWGAGTGLMVRRCRDYGLDCRYYDLYASNVFAIGFEDRDPQPETGYELITAFEVAEHLADPVAEFGKILRLQPRHFLFSTSLYDGEGPDWWYFVENGQHVAFYTRASLAVLAVHFGYRLASNGRDLHLFSREPVTDRLLRRVERSGRRLASKYESKHGSRNGEDFERITRKAGEGWLEEPGGGGSVE